MRYRLFVIAAALVATVVTARPALAIKQFCEGFKAACLTDHPNKEFVAEITKGTNLCLACHQGKKRKNKNAFGAELAKLLDKKKDKNDKEKISAAMAKVLAMHVDPQDETSETYAARVQAGKWPVGTLEEMKKEPKGTGESQAAGGADETEKKE